MIPPCGPSDGKRLPLRLAIALHSRAVIPAGVAEPGPIGRMRRVRPGSRDERRLSEKKKQLSSITQWQAPTVAIGESITPSAVIPEAEGHPGPIGRTRRPRPGSRDARRLSKIEIGQVCSRCCQYETGRVRVRQSMGPGSASPAGMTARDGTALISIGCSLHEAIAHPNPSIESCVHIFSFVWIQSLARLLGRSLRTPSKAEVYCPHVPPWEAGSRTGRSGGGRGAGRGAMVSALVMSHTTGSSRRRPDHPGLGSPR
jgi:hypothetical protein